MSNPNPGFVKEDVYDSVRNQAEKLRQRLEILTEENEQLKEALSSLQAEKGFQKASVQDGEARITDQKMLTDFVLDAIKHKPREVIIKYRGSIVIEVKPN